MELMELNKKNCISGSSAFRFIVCVFEVYTNKMHIRSNKKNLLKYLLLFYLYILRIDQRKQKPIDDVHYIVMISIYNNTHNYINTYNI